MAADENMPLIILSFLAGIVTIAGPCILPILPIILGTSTIKSHSSRPLFIVLGFIISFSAFVVLFSAFGRFIPVSASTLRTVSAALIALFGVSMLFPKLQAAIFARFGAFAARKFSRAPSAGAGEAGPWSGFILGATLGAVWTPCAGPVLGTVLTLVASNRNILQAVGLLIAYAIGAGAPMLLIAYGGQAAITRVRALSRYAEPIQRVFGALIIVVAVGLYFGFDLTIQTYLLNNYPWLFPNRLVNL
jgi:cytochrome c biogenesis protein CcdA